MKRTGTFGENSLTGCVRSLSKRFFFRQRCGEPRWSRSSFGNWIVDVMERVPVLRHSETGDVRVLKQLFSNHLRSTPPLGPPRLAFAAGIAPLRAVRSSSTTTTLFARDWLTRVSNSTHWNQELVSGPVRREIPAGPSRGAAGRICAVRSRRTCRRGRGTQRPIARPSKPGRSRCEGRPLTGHGSRLHRPPLVAPRRSDPIRPPSLRHSSASGRRPTSISLAANQ